MSNKKEQQLKEEIEKAKRKLPTFSGNYTQAECFANILEAGLILEYIEWQIKEAELKGYQQAQKDDLKDKDDLQGAFDTLILENNRLRAKIDKLQLALNIERDWSKRLRKDCEVLEQKIKGDERK